VSTVNEATILSGLTIVKAPNGRSCPVQPGGCTNVARPGQYGLPIPACGLQLTEGGGNFAGEELEAVSLERVGEGKNKVRNSYLDVAGHLLSYLVRSPQDPEPPLVLEGPTVPGRDVCGQLLCPLVRRCDRQFGVGRELDLARISS
jgi:hypothetical protein